MDQWCIVPFIDLWPMTEDATRDLLAQTGGETRVLLVNNGSDDETREDAEHFAWMYSTRKRVLLWSHEPPLPSLGATWNRALEFCWEVGVSRAFVVNNDVRVHPDTLPLLNQAMDEQGLLFVSAVNAGKIPDPWEYSLSSKGGPDFSCFLISKECHDKYPFDSNLTYCNDLDLHRRMLLGGDGQKIHSVLVPYQHFASGTIKGVKPEKAARLSDTANRHREYYARKWGGPVNQERYRKPWDGAPTYQGVGIFAEDVVPPGEDGVTTPELQKAAGIP